MPNSDARLRTGGERECDRGPGPELILHGDLLALAVGRASLGAEEWRITATGAERRKSWTPPVESLGDEVLRVPWVNETWGEADEDQVIDGPLTSFGLVSFRRSES